MSVELLLAFLWGGIVASAAAGFTRRTGRELVRIGGAIHAAALLRFLLVWGAVAVLVALDYWSKGGTG